MYQDLKELTLEKTLADLGVTPPIWASRVLMPRTPFQHQLDGITHMICHTRSGIFDEVGCFSGDTEYLSPQGWKKIGDYTGGEVAQYSLATGNMTFVTPTEFIKLPCDTFLHLKSIAVDQMLSSEHRVLYQNSLGKKLVTSASKIYARHKGSKDGWAGRFLTTFNVQGVTHLPYTDEELRVMVAILADGNFSSHCLTSKLCAIRVSKLRKIARLEQILKQADIPYDKRNYVNSKGVTHFSFYAPERLKTYSSFWGADARQLAIIVDEVFHWDGHTSGRARDGRLFYSTHKGCADFIQYAVSSTGRRASITKREQVGYGTKPVYVVTECLGSSLVSIRGSGDQFKPINIVPSEDGFKYCFSVPETYLVMRRNDKIFVSGNTGKTLSIQGYGLYLLGQGNKVVYVMPPILIPQFAASLESNYVNVGEFVSTGTYNVPLAKRKKMIAEWEMSGYPDFMLCSYILFVKHHLDLLQAGYTCVVVDEATAVKNHESKLFAAVWEFIGHKTPDEPGNGLVLVTGTPVDTNVKDAYGLIRLMDYYSYTSYRNFEYTHFEMMQTNFGRVVIDYKQMDKLHHNLMKQSRRVLKADVLDLPPRLITEFLVDLSPSHNDLYNQVIEDRMLEIGDELIDMTTQQALYQATQQLLLNPEKFGTEVKDNALFEALDEIIESLSGRKIVVYVWFNHSVDTICERYKHLNPAILNGGITGNARELNKQKFISDETCKLLVANPKSGGVGVDMLQSVCSHMVFAEVCPFVGTFQQAMGRLHRSGQKETTVNIYLLVAKNTVAVKLRNNLVKKDGLQEEVMKDKRSVLQDLLGWGGIKGTLD